MNDYPTEYARLGCEDQFQIYMDPVGCAQAEFLPSNMHIEAKHPRIANVT
jgi:hypothetical protein